MKEELRNEKGLQTCHSFASTPSTEAAPFSISLASFSTCPYVE